MDFKWIKGTLNAMLFNVKKVGVLTIGALVVFALLFLTCKELPSDPYVAENADCTMLLKTSKEKIEAAYIEDSVEKIFNVGLSITYSEFFDSTTIIVKDTGSTTISTNTLRTFSGKKRDTVWVPLFSKNPGKLSVFSTAYIKGGKICNDDGTILILGTASINHAPVITVTGTTAITSNDTCKLTVTATDQDANLTTGVSMIKAPAGAVFTSNKFTWKPAATYTGTDTVIFVASDNGIPVLSDTEKVIISVRPASIVSVATLQVATFDSANVTFTWQAVDSADLYYIYSSTTQTGTYSLLDSVTSTTYSDSVTATTSYYFVNATDGTNILWVSDTIASSKQLAVDVTPPAFIFPAAIKDSMTISALNFSTEFICRDSSGIASVACSLGTQACTITKINDTVFSVAVNGLPSGAYSTITFTAVDNSFRKNISKLNLTLKTLSGVKDSIAPTVSLIAPAKVMALT